MTSVQQEDLEERIARIKKRNEEIEKKYREAEADRLMALKDNAMVEIKPPKDEDWPREHKYDKLDFTYDVNEEKLAEIAELEEKKKEKVVLTHKSGKDYKIFAEGEGPPPDPAYSFLADVERDGEKAANNKNNKNNFERRTNPSNRSGRLGSNNSNNSSNYRGRVGKNHNNNLQRSFSNNENDGWRNDRERMDDPRNDRQKSGDQKWRREWDGEKNKDENNLTMKHEPNLTVSISQDGEFKSVKVTSPPIIGSGRVGPRQPAKPQFQFQTTHNHNEHHHNNYKPQHRNNQNDSFNRSNVNRKSDKERKTPNSSSKSSSGSNGGGSVQDRLNRNRVINLDKNENTIRISTNLNENTNGRPATLKSISKIIEKNIEMDEKLAREMQKENEILANKVKEFRKNDDFAISKALKAEE